jgi:hypothetical protein
MQFVVIVASRLIICFMLVGGFLAVNFVLIWNSHHVTKRMRLVTNHRLTHITCVCCDMVNIKSTTIVIRGGQYAS